MASDDEDFDFEVSDDDRDAIDTAEQLKLERGERFASLYLQGSRELLASAKLEPDWLVPGAVVAGGVTFLVGKPGSNKSWLGYDLVCAALQGRTWLNFQVPPAPRSMHTALVLNFDNPGPECARRFLRLGLQPHDRAWFHSLGSHEPPEGMPAMLQLPVGFEPLDAIVYLLRPTIVLVDSLRQAHTGDESSSQEMAQVMSQLRRFATYGSSVIVIHHTRKNDGALRGSTEIEASADAIVDVEDGTATWRKTRGWEMGDPTVMFRVEDDGDMTFVRGGQSIPQLLAEQGPLTRSDIANVLKLTQSKTKAVIDRLMERGVVVEIRDGGSRLVGLPKGGPK